MFTTATFADDIVVAIGETNIESIALLNQLGIDWTQLGIEL